MGDTYLRPSTFGQLLSSRPIAYLPSVARSYSRPGPLRLFPFARHRKVFPQRRAPGDHLSRPPPRAAAGVGLLMLEVARGGTSLPPPFPHLCDGARPRNSTAKRAPSSWSGICWIHPPGSARPSSSANDASNSRQDGATVTLARGLLAQSPRC